MSDSIAKTETIKRTGDHSIDFRYYENRARCTRAQTALELFRMLFSDKHNSLDQAAGNCLHH